MCQGKEIDAGCRIAEAHGNDVQCPWLLDPRQACTETYAHEQGLGRSGKVSGDSGIFPGGDGAEKGGYAGPAAAGRPDRSQRGQGIRFKVAISQSSLQAILGDVPQEPRRNLAFLNPRPSLFQESPCPRRQPLWKY